MRESADDTVGVWDSKLREIIIKRSELVTSQHSARILLHEVAHAMTGTIDCTRDFENVLSTYLGKAAVAAIESSRPGKDAATHPIISKKESIHSSMNVTVSEGATLREAIDAAIESVVSRLPEGEMSQVKITTSTGSEGQPVLNLNGPDEILLKLKASLDRELANRQARR